MTRSDLHARPTALELPIEVAQVAWPEEADRRLALARAGTPRLLLIAFGHRAPAPLDLNEDWVRVPATTEEVGLRSANLRRRLLERDRPVE